MISPAKRVLTAEDHTANSSLDTQRADGLPADLVASIRNAALRARKHVTEGYRFQPASAAPTPFSSPTKPTSSSVEAVSAAAPANEILRDVFSVAGPGRYTPTSSPSKRRHIESSDDEGDSVPPLNITDEEASQEALQGRTISADVSRNIRPLRRSAPGAGAKPPAPGLLKFTPAFDHQRSPHRTRGVASDADVFLDSANVTSASEDEMEC